MANSVLSPDVVSVLERATTRGNVLVLPPEQLDRKLYEAVNKALTNAGGKWKKGMGHVFPVDAGPKLVAMLGSGVSIDEKKRDQSFYTPVALADEVAEIADVGDRYVLEPEAGRGALADACMRAGAIAVSCFEINAEAAQLLRDKCYNVIEGDFLEYSPAKGARYLRIVMNPPFTKNQDIKHVNHAIKWLAPGGILVAIMLGNQDRKGFQEIVEKYDPEIIEVEHGAFKESGTDVPTLIVKIQLPATASALSATVE